MNNPKPIFGKLSRDPTLLTTHIALYFALFISWQRQKRPSPFQVNRRELMQVARIASLSTYHKCIKELSEKRYIIYRPSYHPKMGSSIDWPKS